MNGHEEHARFVRRFPDVAARGECRIVRTDWPYDCIAKGENPTDAVYVCETHLAWWHEPCSEDNTT